MSQLDTPRSPTNVRKFRLGRERKSIGGVCAGIADYFGWDVTMVRLGFVLTTIFLTGAPIIVYLIMWAIAD